MRFNYQRRGLGYTHAQNRANIATLERLKHLRAVIHFQQSRHQQINVTVG